MPIGSAVSTPSISGGAVEAGLSGVKQHDPVRDLELERLRRIEANYEKDKAMLAKEAPALARSDSHDVGHAEGGEEEADLEKIATKQLKNVVSDLRKRKGV
jgi:hypothetical protein